jgi:hypothetical protein
LAVDQLARSIEAVTVAGKEEPVVAHDEALELPGDSGQRILVYTAEPGTPSQEGLKLLASWSSTPTLIVVDAEDDG